MWIPVKALSVDGRQVVGTKQVPLNFFCRDGKGKLVKAESILCSHSSGNESMRNMAMTGSGEGKKLG